MCFDVELPLGKEQYSIKMLDGFIEKGWLDYISFGDVSTGGWAERDGMICCVRSSYDLDSEAFRVSLLRHEAQHMQDLRKNPDMKSERLEYRAKLVELIYSEERDLLVRFQNEADAGTASNAHGKAAMRIVDGIYAKAKTGDLTRKQVQKYAMELFMEDVRRG